MFGPNMKDKTLILPSVRDISFLVQRSSLVRGKAKRKSSDDEACYLASC